MKRPARTSFLKEVSDGQRPLPLKKSVADTVDANDVYEKCVQDPLNEIKQLLYMHRHLSSNSSK